MLEKYHLDKTQNWLVVEDRAQTAMFSVKTHAKLSTQGKLQILDYTYYVAHSFELLMSKQK